VTGVCCWAIFTDVLSAKCPVCLDKVYLESGYYHGLSYKCFYYLFIIFPVAFISVLCDSLPVLATNTQVDNYKSRSVEGNLVCAPSV